MIQITFNEKSPHMKIIKHHFCGRYIDKICLLGSIVIHLHIIEHKPILYKPSIHRNPLKQNVPLISIK